VKYSKATNYALHTVLFLAAAAPDKPVSVQRLAEVMKVSPTYLSKILTMLVKNGIIQSVSGVNGGYSLSPGRKDLSILDIIQAIEGKESLFDCYLIHDPDCIIKKAIISAEIKMEEELKSQKISVLAKQVKISL
jgi:Rrf2 family protein